jgi:2-polyprenyl-3-methyl-5-hydroxy-6-metoxy-1,4-benzoquinol methylase
VSRQEKYGDSNPVVRFVIRRFFAGIGNVVAGLMPESVLDAGCGEGELLRRGVLRPGVRVVCLDQSLDALAEAPSPDRVRGLVEALPFKTGSFDVVLCMEVLEHLPQPAAAIRELARVARKAVVLSVPHEPWFRTGNVLRGKHLRGFGNHPEHVQHWNIASFGAFLSPTFPETKIIEAFPWIIACCRLKQR